MRKPALQIAGTHGDVSAYAWARLQAESRLCTGLQFGIYSDAGYYTCTHFTGSLGFETEDAQQFATWDVDLLKYDR